MVVNKISYGSLLLALIIISAGCAGWPQVKPGQPSDVEVRLQGWEQQDKNGGNPYLKENQSVLEPVIILHRNLGNDWDATLRYSHDYVRGGDAKVIQSQTKVDAGDDARSGASQDLRRSTAFTLSKKLENSLAAVSVGYSKESDYLSRNITLSYTKFLFDNNTSLTFRGSKYFDIADDIDRFGVNSGQKNRATNNFGFDFGQYLSPRDNLVTGISYTDQKGLLSTPRNFVVTANGTFDERLPDIRNRYAIYAKERHAFDKQNAVEASYRYYWDSWGLTAHTPELRFFHDFSKDEYILALNYRYHRQTGIKYFSDTFVTMPKYATQDADLANLSSNALGAIFTFPFSPNIEAELDLESYRRSDKIDGILWTIDFKYKDTANPVFKDISAGWAMAGAVAVIIIVAASRHGGGGGGGGGDD